MGIETVITCDRCEKKIVDEDFTSIELGLETDMNVSEEQDVRKASHRIFCIPCGSIVWPRLLTTVNEKLHNQ